MKIAGIVILAAFYGCYFGKMLHQRQQGITTNQMGKGKHGFVWWVEMTLKITTILVVVAELVSLLLGTTAFPLWLRCVGAGLGAAGAVFFWLSVLTMKNSWRAGVPETDETEFVSRGVFQISRNPAFLGFDLTYLGFVLMFFNPWHCAIAVLAMLMMHLQIVNVEEPFLQQRFGEEYLTYQKTVCRYLGRKRR